MSYINNDFSRLCDDNGICHCDWRLTASGCQEEQTLKNIYIVNAVMSGCGFLLVSCILYHRVVNLKQTLLDYRSVIPRPKPIETMGVFGLIFNLLRVIHGIIMVTDAAPNVAFRSFAFEFPWQFGIAALTCYFFGIANTLSDSSRTLYEAWIRSPIIVDSICIVMLCLPLFTTNVCGIAGGILALQGKLDLATRFTKAQYFLWALYTTSLGIFIIYAGARLIHLLNKHLLKRNDVNVDIKKIHTGALKVKLIVGVSSTALFVFSCILYWYASSRESSMVNLGHSLAICVLWTYDGAIVTILIALAVTINPQMAALLSGSGIQSIHSSQSAVTTLPHWMSSSDSKQHEFSIFSHGSAADKAFQHYRTSVPRSPPPPGLPSRIEEDQLQYNAMTGFSRLPRKEVPLTHESEIHEPTGTLSVSSSATKLLPNRDH